MAQGRKTALTLRLTPRERLTLMAWQRSTTITLGCARRARMILLLADGMPIAHIADTVGITVLLCTNGHSVFSRRGWKGSPIVQTVAAGPARLALAPYSQTSAERLAPITQGKLVDGTICRAREGDFRKATAGRDHSESVAGAA